MGGNPTQRPGRMSDIIKLEVVQADDSVAIASITSWRPLQVTVKIGDPVLRYQQRVLECHAARNDMAGMAWCAEKVVMAADELVASALRTCIHDELTACRRLDSACMMIALLALASMPIATTAGALSVLACLAIAQTRNWVGSCRCIRLQRLIGFLAINRNERVGRYLLHLAGQSVATKGGIHDTTAA